MAGKELPQVFLTLTDHLVVTQQPRDRLRNLVCRAAVAHRTGDGLMFSDGAAHAEVVGVHELAVLLDLLAFETKVSNPVLSATVRTTGDVQFQVLLEPGHAIVQLFGEPARKRLRLGYRDLAELGAGAGNDASAKRRAVHRQAGER